MKTKTDVLILSMRLLSHTLLLLLCYFLSVVKTYGHTIMIAPLAVAGIAAGVQAIGSGAQAIASGKLNRKNRAWQEKMYATQRADSLSDWQMQNAYNSPEQQMQRLRDAGLNPNLVYGDGNVQGNAGEVRSSQVGNPQTETPNISGITSGIQSGIMAYTDMKARQAQTDNLKAQNELIGEQVRSAALDNAAKQMTYMLEAESKNVGSRALIKTTMDKAVQELYNLRGTGAVLDAQDADITQSALLKGSQYNTEMVRRRNMQDENTRAWIMNSTNVKEAASRMVSMAVNNAKSQAEIDNILVRTKGEKFTNEVKALEARLASKGIKPGDPLYSREISNFINNFSRLIGRPNPALKD